MIRRIHVQTDNVPYLLDQKRIAGKLKRFGAMRLKSKRSPNPTDRRLAHAGLIRQGACTPMRGSFRNRLQSELHDFFYGVVSELAGRTRPWFLQQRIDPTSNEAIAPESHRKAGGLQVASHRGIISARGATQNDSGTESHGAARAGLTCDPLQFLPLRVTHDQFLLFWTAAWVGHALLQHGLFNNA